MFIDIHELQRQQLQFATVLPPGGLDFGKDIAQVEPLETSGIAELVRGSDIYLAGRLRTRLEVSCARCLEPVDHAVNLEFDLYYHPVQSIARDEEVEIKPADLDIGFYHGSGLMLEDVLKEQILLSLPIKLLCRSDCVGLCPRCGKNLNLGPCDCPAGPADIRWAPLSGFQKTK